MPCLVGWSFIGVVLETAAPPSADAWPSDPSGATYITVDTDVSAGADFTTLSAAVADLPSTFTAPYIITVAASAGTADTTPVEFYDVGATDVYPLIVRPTTSNRHGGVWDTSVYRLEVTGSIPLISI